MSYKLLGLTLAALAVATSGCATMPVRPDPPENNLAKASQQGTAADFAAQGVTVTSADLLSFNASAVRGDLSQGNLNFTFTNATATATLLNGTSPVATQTFPVYRSGSNVYFSDPAAVNQWVHSYATSANGFSVEMGPFAYNQHVGANNFVVEIYYDVNLFGGGSSSSYYSTGNGGCGGVNCQQQ